MDKMDCPSCGGEHDKKDMMSADNAKFLGELERDMDVIIDKIANYVDGDTDAEGRINDRLTFFSKLAARIQFAGAITSLDRIEETMPHVNSTMAKALAFRGIEHFTHDRLLTAAAVYVDDRKMEYTDVAYQAAMGIPPGATVN